MTKYKNWKIVKEFTQESEEELWFILMNDITAIRNGTILE